MRQIRKINDAVEEYSGAAMGDTWYAANGYISYAGDLPLSRLDVVNGAVIELPEPEPTEEWVPISAFVMALYALIPAERVAEVLQNQDALKPALAGLALLSSDAAPNGMLNILDERVSEWLSLVDLTLDDVRSVMQQEDGENGTA